MNTCKNCSTGFEAKYCPNCGVSVNVKRIDRKYLLHELEHGVLHFEKGFFYTTKELMLRPGHAIKGFLEGNRLKHFKPIGYVIICSVIYSFLSHHFGPKLVLLMPDNYVGKIFMWIFQHYNYSNLIEIIFIALPLTWFFKKRGYNYFEYFVMLSYLTGSMMLFGSLLLILSYFTGSQVFNNLLPLITFVYMTWGIGQFFTDKKASTYIKAFLAYLSGFLLFYFSAVILGIVLNLLLKHL
jgi:hypothetical protein